MRQARARGKGRPVSLPDTCAQCGHPKSVHFNGRGSCREWDDHRFCLCAQFVRLRWDKWQPAKVGTQPAIVRFRKHHNPARWAVMMNKPVEFQIKGSAEIHRGLVDRTDPIPFIAYA